MTKHTDKFSSINGERLYKGDFKLKSEKIKIDNNSTVFAFVNAELLLINEKLPTFNQIQQFNIKFVFYRCIGVVNETNCFAMELNSDTEIHESASLIGLRTTYTILNEDFLRAAIYSHQMVLWNKRTRYCGACGTKTNETESNDWMKTCPNCNENYFPKISPAIIVAITDNGKLLMAQHMRMSKEIFTILAGFVNPGESLEECIHREVMEESGIKIKNIKYFSSQPWPFPDSLMIGFKAEYKSGKVRPDQSELTDIKWFKPDEIPEWGNRSSIARALIDDFIRENS